MKSYMNTNTDINTDTNTDTNTNMNTKIRPNIRTNMKMNMKLGRKNFLYSFFLAILIIVLITGYFIFMLPFLYEDHIRQENLDAVVNMHKEFRRAGTYDSVVVRNPSGCMTFSIPMEGDDIRITGKFFDATLTVESKELKEMLHQIRKMAKSAGSGESVEAAEIEKLFDQNSADDGIENLIEELNQNKDIPFSIKLEPTNAGSVYQQKEAQVHFVDENMIVSENTVTDGMNQYSSYFAMELAEDGIYISMLPAMSPDMNEIRPVVLGSIPMITVVILLLVLLFSEVYSKNIVTPIVKISNYAQLARGKESSSLEAPVIQRTDEIGVLSDSVKEMYEELQLHYLEMKDQKEILEEQNKRQEVFMRASSHQLKTPIAAALLLVDGMSTGVGKFSDPEVSLPRIKKQLLSMRTLVENILTLNQKSDMLNIEQIKLEDLISQILRRYEINISEKQLNIQSTTDNTMVMTDVSLLDKILDNLVSNAVSYTPAGELIEIIQKQTDLIIRNYGVLIPTDIANNVFDPFVSGNAKEKGHGLGLYVASYYTELLKGKLSVCNCKDHVETTLHLQTVFIKNS